MNETGINSSEHSDNPPGAETPQEFLFGSRNLPFTGSVSLRSVSHFAWGNSSFRQGHQFLLNSSPQLFESCQVVGVRENQQTGHPVLPRSYRWNLLAYVPPHPFPPTLSFRPRTRHIFKLLLRLQKLTSSRESNSDVSVLPDRQALNAFGYPELVKWHFSKHLTRAEQNGTMISEAGNVRLLFTMLRLLTQSRDRSELIATMAPGLDFFFFFLRNREF